MELIKAAHCCPRPEPGPRWQKDRRWHSLVAEGQEVAQPARRGPCDTHLRLLVPAGQALGSGHSGLLFTEQAGVWPCLLHPHLCGMDSEPWPHPESLRVHTGCRTNNRAVWECLAFLAYSRSWIPSPPCIGQKSIRAQSSRSTLLQGMFGTREFRFRSLKWLKFLQNLCTPRSSPPGKSQREIRGSSVSQPGHGMG